MRYYIKTKKGKLYMQRKIQGDIYHIGLMWFPQTKEKISSKTYKCKQHFLFQSFWEKEENDTGKGWQPILCEWPSQQSTWVTGVHSYRETLEDGITHVLQNYPNKRSRELRHYHRSPVKDCFQGMQDFWPVVCWDRLAFHSFRKKTQKPEK